MLGISSNTCVLVADAASKCPSTRVVLQNISMIFGCVLDKVKNCPAKGESGLAFQNLLGYIDTMPTCQLEDFEKLVCQQMLNSIELQSYLLPSKLYPYLLDRIETVFSDSALYQELTDSLRVPNNTSSYVVDQFMLAFLLAVPLELVRFISRSVKGVVTKDCSVELDDEDKEVIYYIAGSILRGYFRIAYRYKKSAKWSAIMETLKKKVLTTEPTDAAAAWTKKVNRGGLMFITSECQEFCVPLVQVVFQCEKHDGSVDYGEVLNIVTNSELINCWDNMIGPSLSERLSVNLMNDFIKNMCNRLPVLVVFPNENLTSLEVSLWCLCP